MGKGCFCYLLDIVGDYVRAVIQCCKCFCAADERQRGTGGSAELDIRVVPGGNDQVPDILEDRVFDSYQPYRFDMILDYMGGEDGFEGLRECIPLKLAGTCTPDDGEFLFGPM